MRIIIVVTIIVVIIAIAYKGSLPLCLESAVPSCDIIMSLESYRKKLGEKKNTSRHNNKKVILMVAAGYATLQTPF